MRNFKVAVILGLALMAGCSFSAGISRGQELESDLMPSVVVDNDDFRQVHNATVRIRAYNAGKLAWLGSGIAYKVQGNRVFCLSNEHVCNSADKISAEFFKDGRSLGEFDMRVDMCKQNNDGIDVAVISCNIGKTLAHIEPVPFADSDVKVGEECYFVGAARGEWIKGKLGRVTRVTDTHFYSSPTSIGGDSGSSMIQFDEDGEPEIVGVVGWYAIENGERVCLSMHASLVKSVLAGGDIPELDDKGDVPPSSLESQRLIQNLLERLRELRGENKREREGLLNRLSQMQMEHAMAQEESKRLLDLFKKQQDEKLDRIEEKEDSIVEGLSRKFDNLKTLLRWSFYGLVGLLIAALFFKQGWATTVIICMVTFVFRTAKLAYLLMHNAIVAKVKNPKTMSEALEDLQDGISEGIGRKEDES